MRSLFVGGLALLGCAVVLLVLPVTQTIDVPTGGAATSDSGEIIAPGVATVSFDCGSPISPGDYDAGGVFVVDPCDDTFRPRRLISGALAVAGAGLIAAGFITRRRNGAEDDDLRPASSAVGD